MWASCWASFVLGSFTASYFSWTYLDFVASLRPTSLDFLPYTKLNRPSGHFFTFLLTCSTVSVKTPLLFPKTLPSIFSMLNQSHKNLRIWWFSCYLKQTFYLFIVNNLSLDPQCMDSDLNSSPFPTDRTEEPTCRGAGDFPFPSYELGLVCNPLVLYWKSSLRFKKFLFFRPGQPYLLL